MSRAGPGARSRRRFAGQGVTCHAAPDAVLGLDSDVAAGLLEERSRVGMRPSAARAALYNIVVAVEVIARG